MFVDGIGCEKAEFRILAAAIDAVQIAPVDGLIGAVDGLPGAQVRKLSWKDGHLLDGPLLCLREHIAGRVANGPNFRGE